MLKKEEDIMWCKKRKGLCDNCNSFN